MAVRVQLNPTEIFHGAVAGVTFRLRAMQEGRKGHRWGMTDENSWHLNIESVLGEMAVAKYLNKYWSVTPLSARNDGDVGLYEVRTTRHSTGRLILHDDDKDDRQYWLVTGNMGVYDIHGWILGSAGKQPDFWDDPQGGRPAYFVPQMEMTL